MLHHVPLLPRACTSSQASTPESQTSSRTVTHVARYIAAHPLICPATTVSVFVGAFVCDHVVVDASQRCPPSRTLCFGPCLTNTRRCRLHTHFRQAQCRPLFVNVSWCTLEQWCVRLQRICCLQQCGLVAMQARCQEKCEGCRQPSPRLRCS